MLEAYNFSFFLTSCQTTVSVVKQFLLDIFDARQCPMSGANIQA